MNDEGHYVDETPEDRFIRIRKWIASLIRDPEAEAAKVKAKPQKRLL